MFKQKTSITELFKGIIPAINKVVSGMEILNQHTKGLTFEITY